MNFGRVILCILLPPLAVADQGCGTLLIVCILTLFGWVPGALAALVICSNQKPASVAVNVSAGLSEGFHRVEPLNNAHWDSLLSVVPRRHPYEADASQRQLGFLWSLGLHDQASLDALGTQQAHWLIDQAKAANPSGIGARATKQNYAAFLCVGIIVVLLIGGYSHFQGVSETSTSAQPTIPSAAVRIDAAAGAAFEQRMEASRKAAFLKYPALAQPDSPLAQMYRHEYDRQRLASSRYLERAGWPLWLADWCALRLQNPNGPQIPVDAPAGQ